MIIAYWLIGREIVQAIQGGEERAEYGKQIIKDLSGRLNHKATLYLQIYAIPTHRRRARTRTEARATVD